ncbi:uncharacterized protein LOC143912626 [Arctopsyche grandis]|uniref:uncharacterized protein LOC143912626 n=1 Tax=Arctopsyche grandis TaxID=121162 RepID=UPI00406D7560
MRIWSCCQLQVEKDDGLPNRICTSCKPKLESFARFKLTCEQSDKILRGDFISSLNIKTEPIYPENLYIESNKRLNFTGVNRFGSGDFNYKHQNIWNSLDD